MIFERLPIDGVDHAILTFANALIKSLAGFFAEPAVLDHFLLKVGGQETVAPGIVRNRFIKVAPNVSPDVETDDIEQTEAGAIGKPNERARERVHFFDREIVFDRIFRNRAAEETSDAIGDEIRRIFAGNDAFAQPPIGEVPHEIEYFVAGTRAGNHFHQVQVTRRIEEVRAQKVAAEFSRETFRDLSERDTAGVGGEDRVRFANLVDAAPKGALDFEIFGDRFDDPVAVCDVAEIVFEVTWRDQFFGGLDKERARFLFFGMLDAF